MSAGSIRCDVSRNPCDFGGKVGRESVPVWIVSPRILTAQLREREQDGVIVRKVYPVVPPKVEYSLSKAGESLKPLIKAMQDWGDEYLLRTNVPISSRAQASAIRNEEESNRRSQK
jgi:DNA-binding HxlR family transcriptional regulator